VNLIGVLVTHVFLGAVFGLLLGLAILILERAKD